MPFDHNTMTKILLERTDWSTEERIGYMKICKYDLPDIDNYDCVPMTDLPFEQGQHRWLWLFGMTKGVERAAVIQLAAELFKATTIPHLVGVPFFCNVFSDATRDAYYAKAMCMLYRDPSEG
jgi:hypothetical protein